jgi:hypothetical protein
VQTLMSVWNMPDATLAQLQLAAFGYDLDWAVAYLLKQQQR